MVNTVPPLADDPVTTVPSPLTDSVTLSLVSVSMRPLGASVAEMPSV